MAKSSFHVRSTSLPSTSHPLTSRVKEELSKLRRWVHSKSCSWSTTDVLQDGICALMCLYESVEDMLQLQESQRVLIQHRDHRCVDRVLDGTLRLLDVSGTTRDAMMEMKECVQNTQSALRRRGNDSELRNQINAYMVTSKKITKLIHKCHTESKKVEAECPYSPMDIDQDLIAIATILREVEVMTLSVCALILSFMLGSRKHPKQTTLFSVAKFVQSKRISCENKQADHTEFEMVHTVLSSFSCQKSLDTAALQNAKKRLEAVEGIIGNFEGRMEGIFRALVQNRVTLLNILSK
ncbi:hypothetical protein ACHQM5_028491 [Ranunculus cassubicifolius]